jgi:predicted DNA-binding transcriptional regulator YafY
MNRTDRLFAIAEELRSNGDRPVTAESLAQRLEVSTRTIKRDMLALAEAGLPVWGETGPGGGYRLISRPRTLPPVEFAELEATAVAVAISAQESAPFTPFAPEARAALRKILESTPEAARARAGEVAGRVWRLDSRPRDRAARTLDEALRQRRVVRIDYTDAAGADSRSRPIEPLAYAYLDGQWYLLAWCRWREAGRWFRVQRVRRAALTNEAFEERDLTAVFGAAPTGARPVTVGG